MARLRKTHSLAPAIWSPAPTFPFGAVLGECGCARTVTPSEEKISVDNVSNTPQYLESVMLLLPSIGIIGAKWCPCFGMFKGKLSRRKSMPAKKKAAKKKKH